MQKQKESKGQSEAQYLASLEQQQNDELLELSKTLRQLWEESKVHLSYRASLLYSWSDQPACHMESIQEQRHSIELHDSDYDKISRLIESRENLLNILKCNVEGKNLHQIQLEQSVELLAEIRAATLKVAIAIHNWKIKLASRKPFVYQYYHGKDNYLLKIIRDSEFVYRSKLSLIFSVNALEVDPLFVKPLVKSNSANQRLLTKLKISTQQASQIHLANNVISSQKLNTLYLTGSQFNKIDVKPEEPKDLGSVIREKEMLYIKQKFKNKLAKEKKASTTLVFSQQQLFSPPKQKRKKPKEKIKVQEKSKQIEDVLKIYEGAQVKSEQKAAAIYSPQKKASQIKLGQKNYLQSKIQLFQKKLGISSKKQLVVQKKEEKPNQNNSKKRIEDIYLRKNSLVLRRNSKLKNDSSSLNKLNDHTTVVQSSQAEKLKTKPKNKKINQVVLHQLPIISKKKTPSIEQLQNLYLSKRNSRKYQTSNIIKPKDLSNNQQIRKQSLSPKEQKKSPKGRVQIKLSPKRVQPVRSDDQYSLNNSALSVQSLSPTNKSPKNKLSISMKKSPKRADKLNQSIQLKKAQSLIIEESLTKQKKSKVLNEELSKSIQLKKSEVYKQIQQKKKQRLKNKQFKSEVMSEGQQKSKQKGSLKESIGKKKSAIQVSPKRIEPALQHSDGQGKLSDSSIILNQEIKIESKKLQRQKNNQKKYAKQIKLTEQQSSNIKSEDTKLNDKKQKISKIYRRSSYKEQKSIFDQLRRNETFKIQNKQFWTGREKKQVIKKGRQLARSSSFRKRQLSQGHFEVINTIEEQPLQQNLDQRLQSRQSRSQRKIRGMSTVLTKQAIINQKNRLQQIRQLSRQIKEKQRQNRIRQEDDKRKLQKIKLEIKAQAKVEFLQRLQKQKKVLQAEVILKQRRQKAIELLKAAKEREERQKQMLLQVQKKEYYHQAELARIQQEKQRKQKQLQLQREKRAALARQLHQAQIRRSAQNQLRTELKQKLQKLQKQQQERISKIRQQNQEMIKSQLRRYKQQNSKQLQQHKQSYLAKLKQMAESSRKQDQERRRIQQESRDALQAMRKKVAQEIQSKKKQQIQTIKKQQQDLLRRKEQIKEQQDQQETVEYMRQQIMKQLREEFLMTNMLRIPKSSQNDATLFRTQLKDAEIKVIPGVIPRIQEVRADDTARQERQKKQLQRLEQLKATIKKEIQEAEQIRRKQFQEQRKRRVQEQRKRRQLQQQRLEQQIELKKLQAQRKQKQMQQIQEERKRIRGNREKAEEQFKNKQLKLAQDLKTFDLQRKKLEQEQSYKFRQLQKAKQAQLLQMRKRNEQLLIKQRRDLQRLQVELDQRLEDQRRRQQRMRKKQKKLKIIQKQKLRLLMRQQSDQQDEQNISDLSGQAQLTIQQSQLQKEGLQRIAKIRQQILKLQRAQQVHKNKEQIPQLDKKIDSKPQRQASAKKKIQGIKISVRRLTDIQQYERGLQEQLPSQIKDRCKIKGIGSQLESVPSFTILQVEFEGKHLGEAIILRTEDRALLRLLFSWEQARLYQLFGYVTEWIFQKDPVKEIQFRFFVRPARAAGLIQFEKQFSKIGTIYQKIKSQGLIQRLYVYLRPFHMVYQGKQKINKFDKGVVSAQFRILSANMKVQTKSDFKQISNLKDIYLFHQICQVLSLDVIQLPQNLGLLNAQTIQTVKKLKKQPSRMSQLLLTKNSNIVELNRKLISLSQPTVDNLKDPYSRAYSICFGRLKSKEPLGSVQISTLELGRQRYKYHVSALEFGKYQILTSSLSRTKMLLINSWAKPNLKMLIMDGDEFRQSRDSNLYQYLQKYLRNPGPAVNFQHQHLWVPMFQKHQQIAMNWFGRQIYIDSTVTSRSEYYMEQSHQVNPNLNDWVVGQQLIIGALNQAAQGQILWAWAINKNDYLSAN